MDGDGGGRLSRRLGLPVHDLHDVGHDGRQVVVLGRVDGGGGPEAPSKAPIVFPAYTGKDGAVVHVGLTLVQPLEHVGFNILRVEA